MKLTFHVVILAVLLISASPVMAGYHIASYVEEFPDSYQYTWSVHNENMGGGGGGGFNGLFIEVPLATSVLSYQVPFPFQSGYWVCVEVNTSYSAAQNYETIRSPSEGHKWIVFWGHGVGSLYPRGTSAILSILTDKSTTPGLTTAGVVTYPDYIYNNQSLYYGVMGPSAIVPEPSSLLALTSGLVSVAGFVRRRK